MTDSTLDRARVAPANLLRSPAALARLPSPATSSRPPRAVNDTPVSSSGTAANAASFLHRRKGRNASCRARGDRSGRRITITSTTAAATTTTTTTTTTINGTKAVPDRETPAAQPVACLLARQAQPSEQDPHVRRLARGRNSSSSSSSSSSRSDNSQRSSSPPSWRVCD
jgi:hypothetical protein